MAVMYCNCITNPFHEECVALSNYEIVWRQQKIYCKNLIYSRVVCRVVDAGNDVI